MFWLPPYSRGGAALTPSGATRVDSAPVRLLMIALSGFGGNANGGARSGSVLMRAASRAFHLARSSAEGAVAIRPGCVMPVNDTPGICREVAVWPWKSHIAL